MTGTNARPSVHVSIDVPDLDQGVQFYCAVFEAREKARPMPTMAILDANNVSICVHQKAEGSNPTPMAQSERKYMRHWTPVHLDLHVADFDAVLATLQRAGGAVELEFRNHGPKPVAFCSDPFGNGFCVIGE